LKLLSDSTNWITRNKNVKCLSACVVSFRSVVFVCAAFDKEFPRNTNAIAALFFLSSAATAATIETSLSTHRLACWLAWTDEIS